MDSVLLQALVRTLSGVMNKISNIIPNSSDAPASTLSDSASGSMEENWTDEDALEIAFSQVWSVCSSDRTYTDKGKANDKGTYTWYSTSLWNTTSESLRYSPCSQGISSFFLHTLTFNPQSEWAIADFAFPAIAGTHLPTPEGWKAELAWVASYVVRLVYLPEGSHPSHY